MLLLLINTIFDASALMSAIGILWLAFHNLRKEKDAEIRDERLRCDRLLHELKLEEKAEKEFIIAHYERVLKVIRETYRIDMETLIETAKTERITPEDIKRIHAELKERHDSDPNIKNETPR